MQDMRLQITDIGAISHTDMRLDDITVLVGENGTGKSTNHPIHSPSSSDSRWCVEQFPFRQAFFLADEVER